MYNEINSNVIFFIGLILFMFTYRKNNLEFLFDLSSLNFVAYNNIIKCFNKYY